MRLPLLVLHISSGILGILSGFAAVFLRKGSRQHGIAGNLFFISMLIMSGCAVDLAFMKHQIHNIFGRQGWRDWHFRLDRASVWVGGMGDRQACRYEISRQNVFGSDSGRRHIIGNHDAVSAFPLRLVERGVRRPRARLWETCAVLRQFGNSDGNCDRSEGLPLMEDSQFA